MSGRLANKVAVVTGAASGIGEAVARSFAAEGARVLMTDLNAEAGERIAAELGSNALFMRQDVSDPASWQALVTLVRERFQRLDVLVNNAGSLIPGNIEETTLEQWHKLMRVNA